MRTRLTIAALLALSATTAQAAKPAAPSDSALHAYVIGRYAVLDNEVGLAARLMEEARAADPAAASIKRRSWELALANGDQARAFQLARSLAADGASDPDVIMTRIAEAVIRKDWALAASLRQKLGGQGWPIVVGPVVDAWVAQARGDAGAALNLLDPQRHQGFLIGAFRQGLSCIDGALCFAHGGLTAGFERASFPNNGNDAAQLVH